MQAGNVIEPDAEKLRAMYDLGYEDGKRADPAIKAYLSKTDDD